MKKTESSVKSQNDICALCLKPSVLRQSHIISEFLYKPLYDSKHRLNVLSTNIPLKRAFELKGINEATLFLLTPKIKNMIVSQHVYTREELV